MKLTETRTKKPYLNVIFGNFYSPAYDDEKFIDETMGLIRRLGYNSVMFDTKAWEDFRERYETGALSQYVKMQEYMGKSAHRHGLTYNFLLLYLNGDNLYPHIRYSPPIFGEEISYIDGTPGRWYKYWSEAAKESMREHVERIMESYKDGCTRCVQEDGEGSERTVVPVCSMWDPVVAASFDEEGISRYRSFLKEQYHNDIQALNRAYAIEAASFEAVTPYDYWYPLRYQDEEIFTEEDVRDRTPKFMTWCDSARWKIREMTLYFQDMQTRLKQANPDLFLCPDMTQWGYFLNIYGRIQCDQDNDFSDLWDTAIRGIDIYALAPYVDSCHFITVPTTPDGLADAYVTSCQHSMMRVMNEGKPLIGGTYWGRYIYNDLYASLTPAEIVGTMAACGIDGYTCYGMNGLDDGGVMNRMDEDFLESLRIGNEWLGKVLEERSGARKKEVAILFPAEMAHYEPFEVGNNKIRRLDLLGWYKICCDLGCQADVLSFHEIEQGALDSYRMLIVPSNDCYGIDPHPEMEERVTQWVRNGGVLLHGPYDRLAKNCFGIEGEPCKKLPYRYGKVIIAQGTEFCRYHGGVTVAPYVDEGGCCVARYEEGNGAVYSFGVMIGASYTAKNIPHVPYDQNNKEMYPIRLAGTTLLEDIFGQYLKPESGIACRGIETGVFANGMVIVNHRPTPYTLPRRYESELYQYEAGRTADGRGVLMPHTAVWVKR